MKPEQTAKQLRYMVTNCDRTNRCRKVARLDEFWEVMETDYCPMCGANMKEGKP